MISKPFSTPRQWPMNLHHSGRKKLRIIMRLVIVRLLQANIQYRIQEEINLQYFNVGTAIGLTSPTYAQNFTIVGEMSRYQARKVPCLRPPPQPTPQTRNVYKTSAVSMLAHRLLAQRVRNFWAAKSQELCNRISGGM